MAVNEYDVIVVGSGPAGATASTLLAQQGHSVIMIERDEHPKFHIGESLLPFSAPIFDRLGIEWEEGQYLPKGGAEFINEKAGFAARFPLSLTYQPYQVERSKFDLMMVENANKHGVIVHQNEAVEAVDIDAGGVRVSSENSHYTARYLIDATGRDAMMGKKQRSIERIANLGRFALYTHYKKADSKKARAMYECGDIKVFLVDIGWIWVIPLVGDRLSVGLVVHDSVKPQKKGEALFEQYINQSDFLPALLEGAEVEAPVRVEADFSFYNKNRYGARFACCGDASGFLDPIFSSGVLLAVTSAERVADRVDYALKENRENDADLHLEDDADYLLGLNSMLLFVGRFYNNDLVKRLLLEANRNESVKNDIMGLLGGDLWTGSNTFQEKLLSSRQAQKVVP